MEHYAWLYVVLHKAICYLQETVMPALRHMAPAGISTLKNILVMKKVFAGLILTLLCIAAHGQWKAQSGETYDRTFRMALVTSKGGTETLRILRTMPASVGQKNADPYSQVTGQILLHNKPDKDNKVQGIVLKFDDSPKLYIHQPPVLKQEWDNGAGRYIVESDWQLWRVEDSRDKQAKPVTQGAGNQVNQISLREIIGMLKAGKMVSCQVIMNNQVYGTQSAITTEFTLQNSTKSIAFLFK